MLIKKLIFIGVPDMEQQYRRPFELSASGQLMDELENALEHSGVSAIRPTSLTDVIATGMRFSGTNMDKADINGGWNRHRYRFILELEIDPPSRRGSPGYRVVVTGYTESSDCSLRNDDIPEDMRMFINGVIGIRDTIVMDRGRETIESEIQKPYQILRGISRRGGQNDVLSRPSDLFGALTIRRDYGDEKGTDLRARFRKPEASLQRNNTRSGYLARVIAADYDARLEAAANNDSHFNLTRDTVARDLLRDPKVNSNEFINVLASFQPDMHDNVSFLYEDLARFSRHEDMRSLDDTTTIMNFDENEFDYDSVPWKGADGATMAAVTISRELPAFMLDRCLSSVIFIIDNNRLDRGEAQYEIIDWTSYVDGLARTSDVATALVKKVMAEITDHLTRNNRILLYCRVECSQEGMFTIDVEWDGGRTETFNFPAFADALVPPTYTSDIRNLNDFADRYIKLRKEVIDPEINRQHKVSERDWSK